MKKITSYASFRQEYRALLNKINEAIANLAQYQKVEGGRPDVSLTEQLNRLKLHRRKLEQMLNRYASHKPIHWFMMRDKVRKIYRAARAAYRMPVLSG